MLCAGGIDKPMEWVWIYIIFPIVGAIISMVFYEFVYLKTKHTYYNEVENEEREEEEEEYKNWIRNFVKVSYFKYVFIKNSFCNILFFDQLFQHENILDLKLILLNFYNVFIQRIKKEYDETINYGCWIVSGISTRIRTKILKK